MRLAFGQKAFNAVPLRHEGTMSAGHIHDRCPKRGDQKAKNKTVQGKGVKIAKDAKKIQKEQKLFNGEARSVLL